jgi:hypothetical protein
MNSLTTSNRKRTTGHNFDIDLKAKGDRERLTSQNNRLIDINDIDAVPETKMSEGEGEGSVSSNGQCRKSGCSPCNATSLFFRIFCPCTHLP